MFSVSESLMLCDSVTLVDSVALCDWVLLSDSEKLSDGRMLSDCEVASLSCVDEAGILAFVLFAKTFSAFASLLASKGGVISEACATIGVILNPAMPVKEVIVA